MTMTTTANTISHQNRLHLNLISCTLYWLDYYNRLHVPVSSDHEA